MFYNIVKHRFHVCETILQIPEFRNGMRQCGERRPDLQSRRKILHT